MTSPASAPPASASDVPFEGPPANGLVSIGRFFFKWRNTTFPIIFLAVALLARPVLFGGDLVHDWLLNIAGLSIAALGQSIRCVTVGLDYIKRGGKKKKVYADHLVTGGVFAHGRNPLYVGNILQVIGLVIIHNSPWMYGIILPLFVFVYICIVAAEEQFLEAKFGNAYREYCSRVSRWGISPFGWGQTLTAGHFDWLKLIRKEYGTPFAVATNAMGLLAWESIRNVGWHESVDRVIVLLCIWVPLGALWIAARILKKSGALGSDRATV